jgi:hypothetical protein
LDRLDGCKLSDWQRRAIRQSLTSQSELYRVSLATVHKRRVNTSPLG